MTQTTSHEKVRPERSYVTAHKKGEINIETDSRTGIRRRSHPGNRSKPLDLRTNDPFWSGASFNVLKEQHRAMGFLIECPIAMFTDILSQASSPASYPTPTYGALRQILQDMAPHLRVDMIPLGVEIVKAGTPMPMSHNLCGPERKNAHHKKGASAQFHPVYLQNCAFKVFFAVKGPQVLAAVQKIGRRVRSQNGYVFAGRKEMPADIRAINPETDITDTSVNFTLPVMLKEIIYQSKGEIDIFSDVRCENGRLLFPLTCERIQTIK